MTLIGHWGKQSMCLVLTKEELNDVKGKVTELRRGIINKIKDNIAGKMSLEGPDCAYLIGEDFFDALLGFGIPLNMASELTDMGMAKGRVEYEINRLNRTYSFEQELSILFDQTLNKSDNTYEQPRLIIEEEATKLKVLLEQ